MIDIGVGKPSYRGSLVVVPTPIGNLGDISLRQFEALTKSDIIACEDTRKTGKMLELILDRRMKDRFKNTFGVEWESFFDEDEAKQAPKDKKQSNNNADTEQPEQSQSEEAKTKSFIEEEEKLFYDTGADTDSKILQSLMQVNEQLDQNSEKQLQDILRQLEEAINQNKSVDE